MKNQQLGLGAAIVVAAIATSCGGKEAGAATPEGPSSASSSPGIPIHGAASPEAETSASEHFTGRVVLRDELASGPGHLFVVVGPVGSPMPYLMKKYDVEGPETRLDPNGGRVIDFELTSADNYMGKPLPESGIELKVRFDIDGYVETKEDSVFTTLAVEPGARGLEVSLDRAPTAASE